MILKWSIIKSFKMKHKNGHPGIEKSDTEMTVFYVPYLEMLYSCFLTSNCFPQKYSSSMTESHEFYKQPSHPGAKYQL